jgi:hypothetical protein
MKVTNKFIIALFILIFNGIGISQIVKPMVKVQYPSIELTSKLKTPLSTGLEMLSVNGDNIKSNTTYKTLENGYLLESIEAQLWTPNGWLDYQSEQNTYDLNNNLIQTVTQIFDGLGLVNYERISQTYNQNGNLKSRTEQLWNVSDWENNSRSEYEYNEAGRISIVKHLVPDGTSGFSDYARELYSYEGNPNKEKIEYQLIQNGTWEKASLTEATYIDEERVSEIVEFGWDGENFQPIEKQTFTYTNLLLSILMNSLWDGSNWTDVAQQVYLYDAQSRLVESFSMSFNENTQSWENVYRMVNTYYGTDSLMTIAQTGNITTWENLFKVLTTFTIDGQEESVVSHEWNSTDWQPLAKGEYNYDLNGNLKLYLEYIFEDNDWSIYGRAIFTFIPANPTSVDDDPLLVEEFKLFDNYPNPFNPSTVISWQSSVDSRQTLKVFDILGNEVVTLVDDFRPAGKHSIEFNASGLASGVYLYKITSGTIDGTHNFSAVKKMMLIK